MAAAIDKAGLTGFSVLAHPLTKCQIGDPASTTYEPGISRFLIELYQCRRLRMSASIQAVYVKQCV